MIVNHRNSDGCLVMRIVIILVVSQISLALAGCGSSNQPELAVVRGTVTLEDQPIPNAQVLFDPQMGGRSSTGITDEAGHFQLNYTPRTPGALIGQHHVRVTEIPGSIDEEGKELDRIPHKYAQENGTLMYDVKPGKNEFQIILSP